VPKECNSAVSSSAVHVSTMTLPLSNVHGTIFQPDTRPTRSACSSCSTAMGLRTRKIPYVGPVCCCVCVAAPAVTSIVCMPVWWPQLEFETCMWCIDRGMHALSCMCCVCARAIAGGPSCPVPVATQRRLLHRSKDAPRPHPPCQQTKPRPG
jgi:hypothetical protein